MATENRTSLAFRTDSEVACAVGSDERASALVINPQADPVALLAAVESRAMRLHEALDMFARFTGDECSEVSCSELASNLEPLAQEVLLLARFAAHHVTAAEREARNRG